MATPDVVGRRLRDIVDGVADVASSDFLHLQGDWWRRALPGAARLAGAAPLCGVALPVRLSEPDPHGADLGKRAEDDDPGDAVPLPDPEDDDDGEEAEEEDGDDADADEPGKPGKRTR